METTTTVMMVTARRRQAAVVGLAAADADAAGVMRRDGRPTLADS
jgi:hypothetical protein